MTLVSGMLYLGDNGRCFCGTLRCAGMSAHFTGRDISGQEVLALTPEVLAADPAAESVRCEGCGKGS